MEQSADLRRVEQDLADWLQNDAGAAPGAVAIAGWVQARFARIAELGQLEAEFDVRYQAAADAREQQVALLNLAGRLGASARQLAGDAKSLALYFDREAVIERVRRRAGEEERAIAFGLRQMGLSAGDVLRSPEVESAVNAAWTYDRDPRIRERGFTCLRLALEQNPCADLSEALLWQAQRTALQPNEPAWTQCEALTIVALASPLSAVEVVRRRLSEPLPGDDFFVRRHAVRLVARTPAFEDSYEELFNRVLTDPSAAVRQSLAAELWRRPPSAFALAEHLARDPDAKVRAMLLVQGQQLCAGLGEERVIGLLRTTLSEEADSFVLRTALRTLSEWAWTDPQIATALQSALQGSLTAIHSANADLKVRRWAAQAIEQLWCAADPEMLALAKRVRAAVADVPEGRVVHVEGLTEQAVHDEDRVGRMLAVLAQEGFGLELLPRGKVRHGELITFRAWRLLHEWRNPSSDKRQGFAHWTGRVWRGRTIAPSAIMAELAPTKVPGEPLFQPKEGNWRPWLPLPDMVLSSIDTGKVVSVHSAEGVTEIHPPTRFLERLRSRLNLSRNFAEIAELRNWTEGTGHPPNTYAQALSKLQVRLVLKPHPNRAPDPQVTQFFSVGPGALLAVPAAWEMARIYFSSLYANSLFHLALFVLAAGAWFFGNHILRTRAMRTARQNLALVVGGWGTRGKSGTERLKAAVFSALGHPLVSKTTGNEAMFLYSLPFGEIREMFLFRPYDKATIWEQVNLAVLASKLRAKVFLWECMGLTPAYVKVLQRHWMRDDIATITNTYPDHEDVQGPAGRNIPEVMTNFIPEHSRLITSEEQMRPILLEASRELNTSSVSVGWLEAGLIPDEMLTRFPYEEHPYNIALVTAMAAELDIAPDVAVKEMADRVVQDIGALKVYPEAHVRTRRLEFVLGNSANERFGALGNWARVGFDKQDPVVEPDVWITTVINNRADRVPRSRVFASILVKDIEADRHVLIGSNLEGLRGFIEEAWEDFAPGVTLWPGNQKNSEPLEELRGWAKKLRVGHDAEQYRRIVRLMLRGQPSGEEWIGRTDSAELAGVAPLIRNSGLPDAAGIADYCEIVHQQLEEYRTLENSVRSGGSPAELDRQLREQVWRWFQAKIVVVENYYATGEEIVRLLARITPPGFRNRIMGMQNIKGTGLDFVYRWHGWETVHRASADALSRDPVQARRGLETLASFREYGILSAELVRSTLAELRSRKSGGGEIVDAQLDLVEAQLQEQLALQEKSAESDGGSSRWEVAAGWLEALLDAGDAVRRRKKADLIYRELATERISSARAVVELKKLTTRQKGGWLLQDIKARRKT